jgi:hypothetical protein
MTALTFPNLMQHLMSLAFAGLAIGGVVVVALNLNLSKWTWAVLVGFLVEAIVQFTIVATTFALQSGAFAGGGGGVTVLSAVFMMMRAGGLLGWLLIVGGLWGVFSDIQRRLSA